MAGFIGEDLQATLKAHASKRRGQQASEAAREERTVEIVNALVTSVLAGAEGYIADAKPAAGVDEQKLRARVYGAGLLALVASNVRNNTNYVDTLRVVLARDHEEGGINYSTVTGSLYNVAIHGSFRSAHAAWHPRLVSPAHITEGDVRIHAAVGEEKPEFVAGFGAWVADHEIPSGFSNRDSYVSPDRFADTAQAMLEALNDPVLNPQFRTPATLESMYPYLLHEAADLSRPVDDIVEEVGLFVPEWLQTTPAV